MRYPTLIKKIAFSALTVQLAFALALPVQAQDSAIPQQAATATSVSEDDRIAQTLTVKFRQQFAEAINKAKAEAKRYNWRRSHYAVVFDLDETLLDNRSYFVLHKKYDPALFNNWVQEAQAPAIPEALDFLKWLEAKRFRIYFVTGRRENQRQATVDNLKRIGISRFDGLYLKPDNYTANSAADFKVEARKAIEAKGEKVIIILGDQESDLRGGYGQGFKLPNPIYTIP